jgi:hypothetical protein
MDIDMGYISVYPLGVYSAMLVPRDSFIPQPGISRLVHRADMKVYYYIIRCLFYLLYSSDPCSSRLEKDSREATPLTWSGLIVKVGYSQRGLIHLRVGVGALI